MTHSKNKSKKKIQRKIFTFFALFGIVVLSLLWLSQIILLDDFYYMLLNRTLAKTADSISASNATDIQAISDNLASKHGLCISVYNINGARIATSDTQYNCFLHHVDTNTINGFYISALKNNGKNSVRITLQNPSADTTENSPERVIFTKLSSSADGMEIIIIIDAAVAPVGGVINALTVQLCIVTVIVLIAAIVIAAVMAKHISAPIEKINESAKLLAKGDYSAEFDGGELKEISELADTLNYASQELSQLDKLQKKLIANISHDLRTPLTMIIGYSEMIRDIPGENTQENVDVIIDESKRLSLLVNDLIELSKYQSNAIKPTFDNIDLDQTVRETVERFSKLTEHNGYKIIYSSDGEATVAADKKQLLQVIYNLIQNAINYCGDDKTVELKLKVTGDSALLEIIDHGNGIPADKLPYIWDRYYKIDSVHYRGIGGSGIGLSIVKEILELHNAKYGVKSSEGNGSCFYFELPIVK